MQPIHLDPTSVPEHWAQTGIDDFGIVHFIGIGGAGMSVLAEILHGKGVQVQGSDRERNEKTDRLEALGIHVMIGQQGHNVDGAHIVVWSSAIKPDNPEIVAAVEQGAQLWHRSDVLAWLLHASESITVAGAHGKTTTSAMIATIVSHAGHGPLADPSYAIGGSLQGPEGHTDGGHAGSGQVCIAEADESDGSFCKYRPRIAVITNIEAEHLDHYGDEAHYMAAFMHHVQSAQQSIICCGDDSNSMRMIEHMPDEELQRTIIITTQSVDQCIRQHGTRLERAHWVTIDHEQEQAADVTMNNVSHAGTQGATQVIQHAAYTRSAYVESYTVMLPAEITGTDPQKYTVRLRVPGMHNARNATQALVAATLLGIDPKEAVNALGEFYGAARRFEIRGIVHGVTVVDDYSHHPTEIRALLTAARRRFPQSTLRVLFQPHLYSRTQFFAQDFADALALADDVIVTGIFAAREQQSDYAGVSASTITNCAAAGQRIYAGADMRADAVRLAARAHSGDVLITVGAGDVTQMAEVMLQTLCGGSSVD